MMNEQETIDAKEIEARAVARAKAELRAELTRPAQQPDKFQEITEQLIADGVDKSSIDTYVKLFDVLTEKKRSQEASQKAMYAKEEFAGRCYQETREAIEDVIEPITALKNLGEGFRADLAEEVAELVMSDAKFKDIKKMVEDGRVPPARKLREAAAQVADRKAKELGIAPKAGQLDLSSSKTQPKEEQLTADDLPPQARKFYTIMKNLGKSDADAMARARQALAEMK